MTSVRRSSLAKARELSEDARDPDTEDARALNVSLVAQENLAKGTALFKEEKFTEALAEFQAALVLVRKHQHDISNISTRVFLNKIYSRTAACHMHLQQYDQAIQDAEEMIHLEVSTDKAWNAKALAQRAIGDLDGALHSVRMACRLAPVKSRCIALHAEILKQKGSAEKDVVPHHRSSKGLRTEDDIMDDLMNVSNRSQSDVEANDDCTRGVAMGDLSEKQQRELVQLRFRTKRGEALSHIGRYTDALRDIDAVLATCPKDEHAIAIRVHCLNGLKEFSKAKNEAEAYLLDHPDCETIKEALAEANKNMAPS